MAKSDKSGNGYGHCKSDKSGEGHSKKRGKGHDRDCEDDEPPVPVCVATASDIGESIVVIDVYDVEDEDLLLGVETVSITYSGPICTIGDEVAYQNSVLTDGATIHRPDQLCEYDTAASSVLGPIENLTLGTFWYDMTTVLTCNDFIPGG
jgi:hypothetical protein